MKLIKCSECGKKYDNKLDVCPYCGYQNKRKEILKIAFYIISICLFIISMCAILKYIYIKNYTSNLNEFIINKVDKQFADNVNKITEAYELENYIEKYGSSAYGKVAYNLNNVRRWSMSFCIAFIWFGIYLKHKNIKLGKILEYIAIVAFIIFQLLPLGYTVYLTQIIM